MGKCTWLLAALFVLTACGGGGGGAAVDAGDDGDLRPLALAAVQSNTQSAETAKTRFVVRMSMSGVPDEPDQSFEMRAEGAVDIVNERAQFVVDVPAEFGDEASAELPFDGRTEVIVDGDTAYVRLPAGSAPPGKQWVRTSGEEFDITGTGFTDFAETFDPGLNLDMLGLGEPTNVETLGREDVGGTSTIHYRVTVNPAPDAAADRDAYMQMFSGDAAFVYDVWVDDDERLRKLAFSFDLAAMLKAMFEGIGDAFGEMADEFEAETGQEAPTTTFPSDMSMLMEMEMEAWDFGEPVDIQLPPADQVAEPHEVERF